MKRLTLLFVSFFVSYALFAQNNPITFNPGGSAGGDLFGIKTTETGNNTTKFHIYRNFTYETQDLDRLVIDAAGKVGIGTSSPDMKLAIYSNESSIARFQHSGTAAISGLRIGRSGTYGDLINTTSGFGIGAGTASGNLPLHTQNVGHVDFFISNVNRNVGIGTTSPNARLHIWGESVGNGNIMTSIMIGKNNGPEIQAIQQSSDPDVQGLAFRVKSSATNANPNFEAMRINSNGNIGIGTTTTGTHKLAVEGTIGAREIKVETGTWSDFVFKNDYDLRTLEEVEQHISEKGHLPEIPNEAEVIENGINLGEMNVKLLQKIEELTLYLIDQNKEIKELKALTTKQQTEIERLQKK